MTLNISSSSRGPFRCTLLLVAFLALAGATPASAASDRASSNPVHNATSVQPTFGPAPIAALLEGKSSRTRAVIITAIGMALALFVIIWRRT